MLQKPTAILLLLSIAACTTQPYIATPSMVPRKETYNGVPSNYYLKGKLAINTTFTVSDSKLQAELFQNFPIALQRGFTKAGMLAANPSNAKYIITGEIKNIEPPQCAFGSCETGSAIAYTLTNAATGAVVYNELVVTPHTWEYPITDPDSSAIELAATGGAVAENIAHIIQSLSRKTQSDFK